MVTDCSTVPNGFGKLDWLVARIAVSDQTRSNVRQLERHQVESGGLFRWIHSDQRAEKVLTRSAQIASAKTEGSRCEKASAEIRYMHGKDWKLRWNGVSYYIVHVS